MMGTQSLTARARRNPTVVLNSENPPTEAAVDKVFEGCSSAFRGEMMTLITAQGDRTRETLEFYYRLGQTCKRIKDNSDQYLTEQQQTDGVDPIDLVVKVLHTSKPSIVKAIQFVDTYSREELDRLLDLRNAEEPTYRLHWGHVVFLLSCATPAQRRQFEDRCIRNLWTPDDLHQKIMEANGGPARSGGRPLSRPRTTDAQVRQIVSVTKDWLKRNDTVWNSDSDGTFTTLQSVSPDDVSDELLEQTTELREAIQLLVTAASDDLLLIDAALEYQQTCLEARANQPEPEPTPEPPAPPEPEPTPEPPAPPPIAPPYATRRKRRVASS